MTVVRDSNRMEEFGMFIGENLVTDFSNLNWECQRRFTDWCHAEKLVLAAENVDSVPDWLYLWKKFRVRFTVDLLLKIVKKEWKLVNNHNRVQFVRFTKVEEYHDGLAKEVGVIWIPKRVLSNAVVEIIEIGSSVLLSNKVDTEILSGKRRVLPVNNGVIYRIIVGGCSSYIVLENPIEAGGFVG